MRCAIFPFRQMIGTVKLVAAWDQIRRINYSIILSLLCRRLKIVDANFLCRGGGVLTMSNSGTGRFKFPSGKRRVLTALGLSSCGSN
jgi:hypothetical protein